MPLLPLTEPALNWENLRPTLELTELPTNTENAIALQPRAYSSIHTFLANSHRTLLVLKANEIAASAEIVHAFVQSQLGTTNPVTGVNYTVAQADSFSFARVTMENAQSSEDNFAAKQRVATALYVDHRSLFGNVRQHPVSKDIQLIPGLVHELNGGALILNVSALLSQFDLWGRLKTILLNRRFDWYSAHPFNALPCDIPSYPLELKLILLGNRDELATLAELDPELYSLGDYGEIDSYFSISEQAQQQQWAAFVQGIAMSYQLPPLTLDGLNKLYQLAVRDSEDCRCIDISLTQLREILSKTALISQGNPLSAVHFEQYFQQKQFEQSFLRQQTYADIINEQVYVATSGEIVGQINGLSVIEYPGSPLIFGEPTRISCVVRFGDGEIIDIDRKNELAGNIHGKGMMIAEACLASLLNFPSQLPFSASLVFEQSYSDIDGDSASLATFCALVSALTDLPLPQNIAVTGTIDQFGLVHAVGGVNHKIEGFFAICAQRGLTKNQGVIIPSTTCHQLSLSEEVVSAVKNGEFFIWAVDDIFQTVNLLFHRDFLEEDDKTYSTDTQPLSYLINQRIEQKAETSSRRKFWHWFSRQ